jgi:hypothetical protein
VIVEDRLHTATVRGRWDTRRAESVANG